jgi:hypothetical protein
MRSATAQCINALTSAIAPHSLTRMTVDWVEQKYLRHALAMRQWEHNFKCIVRELVTNSNTKRILAHAQSWNSSAKKTICSASMKRFHHLGAQEGFHYRWNKKLFKSRSFVEYRQRSAASRTKQTPFTSTKPSSLVNDCQCMSRSI